MAKKKKPRARNRSGDAPATATEPAPPSRFTVATQEEFVPPPLWIRLAGLAISGVTATAAAFLISGAIGGGAAGLINAGFGIVLAIMAIVMVAICVAPRSVRSFIESRQQRPS